MALAYPETQPAPQKAEALPVLQLVGVRKTFGDFVAVERIDLDINEGEFLTIVGPSGSGKTTLLRMLAGMEAPSEGNITLRGNLINDVPANRRPTCLVFQSLALFPHKTVGENIEFPLKVKKIPPAQRKARALELLRMLRLPEDYYGKNVMKCSGGEKQRVALARAFAYDPDVLFFDEPLSALDYKLKKVLEKELKDLHRETGKTFIYITHSLEEAMVMSDRIGVMRAGRLVQVGTPEQIYTAPADRFVSEFVGEVNVVSAVREGEGWRSDMTGGPIKLVLPEAMAGASAASVVVRPEFMRFIETPAGADNCVAGTLYNEYSLGSRIQYQVRVGERTLLIELSRGTGWHGTLDQPVLVGWDARDAIVVEGLTMADIPLAASEAMHVTAPANTLATRRRWAVPTGLRYASPVIIFLALGFLAPLVTVAAYAFATPRSFDVFRSFTLTNFATIFDPANTVWMSFAWSLVFAFFTVALLAVVAYPIAYGLNRLFGKWAGFVSVLFVFPLFVSENVRLYGWVLFFIKNGVLDGSLKAMGFAGGPEVLFTPGIILFGMIYVYLPFMLFPMTLGLAMVPRDLVDAARDLGAGRLMIWREIELPLAMPGILIGMLLTFVLAAGAVAEAKILGGQSVIMITHDIEIAFTYSQNWPLGSALAVLLMLIVSGLALFVMSKLDLDRILGRR